MKKLMFRMGLYTTEKMRENQVHAREVSVLSMHFL